MLFNNRTPILEPRTSRLRIKHALSQWYFNKLSKQKHIDKQSKKKSKSSPQYSNKTVKCHLQHASGATVLQQKFKQLMSIYQTVLCITFRIITLIKTNNHLRIFSKLWAVKSQLQTSYRSARTLYLKLTTSI